MKTLYILGAGASADAGLPVMAAFRGAAGDVVADTRGGNDPYDLELFQGALDLWDLRAPGLTIEEFYVMMDLLERLGTLRGYSDKSRSAQYLIAKTLEHKGRTLRRDAMRRFVKTLQDQAARGEEEVVFSLNWDNLFESTWRRETGKAPEFGIEVQEASPSSSQEVSGLRLYKLHGSLDWMLCKKCEGGRVYRIEKLAEVLRFWEDKSSSHSCGVCGSQTVPMFIPPTAQKIEFSGDPDVSIKKQKSVAQKSVLGHLIGRTWSAARMALRGPDRLVVVGYSFPATDAQFRMLLLDILSERDPNHPMDVEIVTNAKTPDRRASFEESYRTSLGLGEAGKFHKFMKTPKFNYEGFETWTSPMGAE